MLDYLIKNAAVLDGSGKKSVIKNVGIASGKLVLEPGADEATARATNEAANVATNEATNVVTNEATEVIDASGYTLAPGFIDVHGHSDLFAFADPLRASKLCQGITTEIGGQCGISPAPVTPQHFAEYGSYYKSMGVPLYPGASGFTGVGPLLDTMEGLKLGINFAMFTAQGSLRIAVKGLDPSPATDEETRQMESLARQCLEEGSFGISTGLMYAPGSFSRTDEIARVCASLKGTDAIYTSHIRNQGGGLIDSVKEALTIAERAGIRANISHHKAVGKPNWGKVRETSALLDAAGATHDVYPYTASSTTLGATLPPSFIRMGMETIVRNLDDAAFVEKLEDSIFHPVEKWDNDILECGFDGILIIGAAATPEALGLTIAQYADQLGIRPFDGFVKLLKENKGAVSDICFSMSQEDVDFLVAQPHCMFGTDSLYVPGFMTMTHPRAIGTFPLILGTYVRDRGLLSLEEAVRKMTGFASDTYGLKNKGYIRNGYDADLVLFDAKTVGARCTYEKPLEENTGIKYVFVNGKIAVKDGKATGMRNGHIIRRA